jgi:hypothetical protein
VKWASVQPRSDTQTVNGFGTRDVCPPMRHSSSLKMLGLIWAVLVMMFYLAASAVPPKAMRSAKRATLIAWFKAINPPCRVWPMSVTRASLARSFYATDRPPVHQFTVVQVFERTRDDQLREHATVGNTTGDGLGLYIKGLNGAKSPRQQPISQASWHHSQPALGMLRQREFDASA